MPTRERKVACTHAPLTLEDLVVGGEYRAKRPTQSWGGEYNDRIVLYIGRGVFNTSVQYDSIAVRDGAHYPTVDAEKFLKWACHRIEEHDHEKA